MARRTTLYQRARSPLIQGFSKHEKPLWRSSLEGALIALIPWVVWAYVRRTSSTDPAEWAREALLVGVVYLAVVAVASIAGAAFGRRWGSRVAWFPAAIIGTAAGIAALAVITTVISRGTP